MSNIIVVGGTGTIGSAVVDRLAQEHDVTTVGHSSGELQVDLAERKSISRLFEQTGPFNHLVCAAGVAEFGPLDELTDADFRRSLDNKLMGQVNLVRIGHEYAQKPASITLTSGVLSRQPIEGSCAISMVNGGLEGFVRAAALDLRPTGPRVNVVSPPWVAETLEQMGRDPSQGAPAADVAEAFASAIQGQQNGEVIEVQGE